MKTLSVLSLIISLMIMSSTPAWAKSGKCSLKTSDTLMLSGNTDAKMLACVKSKDLGSVKTVKVNSRGGSVDEALQIGEILAPLHAEFIIAKQCSSSCANFFLPIARKITLQKNAFIIIHGSMDPGIARKVAQETPDVKGVTIWDIVERQQLYAVKYDIHRGWLMYRETYENGGGSQFDYVNGQLAWMDDPGTIKMILVEERMLRSCLPNVDITPFVDTRADRARAKEKTRRRLVKQGIRLSGTWECIGPSSARLPAPDFSALRGEAGEEVTNP